MCTPSYLFRCGDRVSLWSSLLGSGVYGDREECVCTLSEECQLCPDFFLDALTLYLTSYISDHYSSNKNGGRARKNKKTKGGRGKQNEVYCLQFDWRSQIPNYFVDDVCFVLCWWAFGLLACGEEFSQKWRQSRTKVFGTCLHLRTGLLWAVCSGPILRVHYKHDDLLGNEEMRIVQKVGEYFLRLSCSF